MGFLYAFVLRHRTLVIAAALILTVVCGFLWLRVGIDFSLADYLPDEAASTQAVDKLSDIAGAGLPNASVYVQDVTVSQALAIKARLLAADGVEDVLWLDDAVDVARPVALGDQATVDMFYKDGGARFYVSVSEDDVVRAVAALQEAAGDGALVVGESVRETTIQTKTMDEIGMILVYAVPLVLLILLITTTSWFQPVLFIITIGVAIVINAGTNIFLGKISFVTQATSALLQLAVSIDYAVFLLNRFNERHVEGETTAQRMLGAMKESSVTIAASAMTTVFGFLSLLFMRFKIGPDLGFVLAKGVLISYLSVILFLPPLAIFLEKPLVRLSHRRLIPRFDRFGRFAARACVPIAIVTLLLLVPAYLTQRGNDFVYGSSGLYADDSEVMTNEAYVNSVFGARQEFVLLVPEGNPAAEAALTDALQKADGILEVVSYANQVGAVPPEMLTKAQLASFRAGGFSRIVAYASTSDESAEAFRVVESVRTLADEYDPGENYVLSRSAVNYDLMDIITGDNLKVLAAAVIAIAIVLLFAFKNAFTPLILILTIEGAIWINMSIPRLTGGSLNYLGYQIISSVQLGATIDYGILLTQRYLEARSGLAKSEAAAKSVGSAAATILTPAAVLVTAGTALSYASTNGIIIQMGRILAIGTAISAFMVLFFLPALLMACDRLIRRRKNEG
jgi:predicted RND superfamily exporter protein